MPDDATLGAQERGFDAGGCEFTAPAHNGAGRLLRRHEKTNRRGRADCNDMLHFCKEIYTKIHTMVASMLRQPIGRPGLQKHRNVLFNKTSGMIDTERLILRKHTVADTDLVFQLASDPAVLQSIGGRPPSREDAWHRLLRYAGHWSLLGFGMFAVVERATNQFIGEVGLADFQRGLGTDFDGEPEAAWVFTGHSHGKGFALEAMTAALDWFDQQAVSSRSVCMIEPRNTASIRLAEKLGFTCYGQGCYRHHEINKYERMRPDHQPRIETT